ncbi:MAG: prepilin-type N-terminal cleavage/methylation domain-containing protein [Endomicrobiaceae bacterium]|nr:prepilin-type N-terminal cleavage/methylation domain-containing protein [Endomicrobiaceae bacterium]
MNKKNRKIGFTLIEVLVSLFLSVMVAVFVYTMMISSYNAYRRLSSVSKNANSIRYFIESFSNSVKYANRVPVESIYSGSVSLTFKRYDNVVNDIIQERYYFSGGSEFVKSSSASVSVSTANHHCETLGVLKKDILTKDGSKVLETITVSNVIRTVYFNSPTPAPNDRFRKMNIGVIYDDVVDGNVNKTTGKLEKRADGLTEMLSEATLNRRVYTFDFRGFDAN